MNKILSETNRRSISAKRKDAALLDAAWAYLCQVTGLKPAQVAVLAILLLAQDYGFEEQGDGDN